MITFKELCMEEVDLFWNLLNAKIGRRKTVIPFIISDNGIGISPADLPRVFDKGFTGDNGRRYSKSTGIGLYLCKKLCGKMNIGITIQSALGQGTTVILSFPQESYLQEAGL